MKTSNTEHMYHQSAGKYDIRDKLSLNEMLTPLFSNRNDPPIGYQSNKQPFQLFPQPQVMSERGFKYQESTSPTAGSFASPSTFRLIANQNILISPSSIQQHSKSKDLQSPLFFQSSLGSLSSREENIFGNKNMKTYDQQQYQQYSNQPQRALFLSDRAQRSQLSYHTSREQPQQPMSSRLLQQQFISPFNLGNISTSNNDLPMISPRNVDVRFQQSIVKYMRYFPHLNFTKDHFSSKNKELLDYLAHQEEDLTNQAQLLSDRPSLQEQKVDHLTVVAQLRLALLSQKNQNGNNLSSNSSLTQQISNSVFYQESDGFLVKMHFTEKIPHDVEKIVIDYGLFRRGDQLKTYRQTNNIPTITLNQKFNKAIINYSETFKDIYPTVQTFFYINIKTFSKNQATGKNWGWTLHTIFDEQKKLVQGGFKLPLYSKNHIPHAIFQTGFPQMSDCFVYLEVYLGNDYHARSQLRYEDYVIPALHLRQKNVENIEEDIAIAGIVNENIKQKGIIKTTFQDEEKRKYKQNIINNRLKLAKQEFVSTNSGTSLDNIENKESKVAKTKGYLLKLPPMVESNDIFAQISQRITNKNKPSTQDDLPISEKQIIPGNSLPQSRQIIPLKNNDDIPTPIKQSQELLVIDEIKEQVEDNDQEDTSKSPNKSFYGLSETSMKIKSKRGISSRDKNREDDSVRSVTQKSSTHVVTAVSNTMKQILEKRNQLSQSSKQLDSSQKIESSSSLGLKQGPHHRLKTDLSIFQQMSQKKISNTEKSDQDNDNQDSDISFEGQLRQHIDDQVDLLSSNKKDNSFVIVSVQIKAMKNWKPSSIIYEAMLLDNQGHELARDSNQLSVLTCDKQKTAQFNKICSQFRVPQSNLTNEVTLNVSIRDLGEGQARLQIKEGQFVNGQVEIILNKIGNKSQILKQILEINIENNQDQTQFDNNSQGKGEQNTNSNVSSNKLQVNLIELLNLQTANPIKIQASIFNGSNILQESSLVQSFPSIPKRKSLDLSNSSLHFDQINLEKLAKEFPADLHKIYLVVAIHEEKKMKLEEIGWTFVSLFTEDGSAKSGEQMNLTVFKFPLVQEIHLADVKKLKTGKCLLSLSLN